MNAVIPTRLVFICRQFAVLLLVASFTFLDFQYFLSLGPNIIAKTAYAAQSTVTSLANTSAASHTVTGAASLFVSDQVGYKFFRTASAGNNGKCAYNKTTNGGVTWGADVIVDSQTDCLSPVVWYDQWTPGDNGNFVHIITMDTGSDVLWYNRLDTTSDTLLLGSSPVNISSNSGQSGTFTAGANKQSVTKGTDGTIYAAISDNSDSYIVECTTSCGSTTSWIETGTNPLDLVANDYNVMAPLAGGSIILVNRDTSANDLRSKIWNNTSWAATWTDIDINALENSTYDVGMSAVTNPVTGRVHLVYIADYNNFTVSNHDIRTAYFNGSSWTNATDVLTDAPGGLTNVAMGIDTNTNDIYVGYSRRTVIGTPTSANIYWASSTAAMSTWSTEQGPVNTTSDDIYSVDINNVNDQRLYITWYAASPDAIYGDTILDTSPATIVSATGTQVTSVRASSTNFYLGGKFVIQEFLTSRTLSSVTLSETGSIDASTNLQNIKILYDMDTTAPYDCASESYSGAEPQYGVTDSNGFSGPNGVSSFSASVTISPTQTFCAYPVMEVTAGATDGVKIDIEITNPGTDVVVTGGVTPTPNAVIAINGSTTVSSFPLRQSGFHWRNDNGNETGATSATGGTQNTALSSLARGTPIRLRLAVNNEGSTSTINSQLKLQFAQAAPTCALASGWVGVNDANDDFAMFNSANLTNGNNTTNIAVSSGGVVDTDTLFLTPNGGIRDTSDITGTLNIGPTNFVELEYSIVASTSATQGQTYCFRVIDNGNPLSSYVQYPSATIAADVAVSSLGSHTATADIPAANVYLGGAFVIAERSSSRNVTGLTISQTGTINGASGVSNVKLFYDLDTTSPYNCASESYGGGEAQFGATDSDGFSSAQGSSTFSGSVAISTTSTMCVYTVVDITGAAQSYETVSVRIFDPSSQVVVSTGSVSPSTPVAITGSTTVAGAVVTQTAYHWRNDNGNETGATSATGGSQNTPLTNFDKNQPVRVRLAISNTGGTSSLPRTYTIQYGVKITTCESVVGWTNVGAATNDSFDMFDSANLTNGSDTTDIAIANGGVSDGVSSFLTTNGGVRDTTDTTGSITLGSGVYTDLEYSITTTSATPYETSFCFRLIESGTPLVSYTSFPEITIKDKRDFKIQRGSSVVSGTGLTLTAGSDYTAPSATSSAFVRITNSAQTGAGDISGGGNQNADDVTAYISNPSNLLTSFTISRDTDSINETHVDWEIIEFVGNSGTDNEIKIRGAGVFTMGTGVINSTSSAISGIVDDADVVVFVTGVLSTAGNRNAYNDIEITTSWSSSTDQAVFKRGVGTADTLVSYAVVEFVGQNWNIQRVEHIYTAAGVFETETINPVATVNKAFIYSQKRSPNSTSMSDFGQLVYLSSMGAVSFTLESTAVTPSSHAGVAWVIENLQTGSGAMQVFRSNGLTQGGPEPSVIPVLIGSAINATSNASIFANSAVDQASTNFPRPIAGFFITSTTSYDIWRSDTTGGALDYRTEVVEWPAADVALRQNYYRFYVDNGALKPTDAWPAGATDLGENTSVTAIDEPLADGERIRVRMSVRVSNGTLVGGVQPLKLQYARRVSTCSAVGTWFEVGAAGSGEIWRGYDVVGLTDGTALSIDPPTGGDLLLSVSDRAGTFEEENETSPIPYNVASGEDVELDFVLEQNGAVQRSTYCFRLVKSGDVEFSQYLNYPQIRTNGYSPATEAWRWFDDENSETPVTALAPESVSPVEVQKGNTIKLRVTVDETNNLGKNNARFKLQFADNPSFTDPQDVVATTTCTTSSIWCYADGGGLDNATTTTSLLSTSDICIASSGPGCGTHNESPFQLNGFRHNAFTAQEYDFTIQYQNIADRFGQVWYFRLYDIENDIEVPVNGGYTPPSLVGQSGTMNFTVSGLPQGTTTEGVVTDATTTAYSVPFGTVDVGSSYEAAQRLSVETDAVFGYTVYTLMRSPFSTDVGSTINPISGTNAAPVSWGSVCTISTTCIGYHAGDDTLDGASARFSANDSYAGFNSVGDPIMYNAGSGSESSDIIYKLQVNELQAPGDYVADIVYIAVPTF